MSAGTGAVGGAQPASAGLFLPVVAVAVFVSVLTATMINVLIPVIRDEFGASAAQVGWVVTGYALAYAIGVPLYGKVSDLFGVRRVFTLGLLGFASGGLICALAPSFAVLVLGRVVQGIGGAAIPALAFVAVAKVLPPGGGCGSRDHRLQRRYRVGGGTNSRRGGRPNLRLAPPLLRHARFDAAPDTHRPARAARRRLEG